MPNTPNLALPYPQLSDAPNVPQHIQNLASALDGRAPTTGSGTAFGITVASGWSLQTDQCRCLRFPLGASGVAMVFVQVAVNRTGATITAGSSGNISDQTVAYLPVGYRPDSMIPVVAQVVTGAPASGKIEAAGNFDLQELAPNGTIAAGILLRFAVAYLTAPGT